MKAFRTALTCVIAFLLVIPFPAAVQEPSEFQCGTGPENDARLEELNRWMSALEKARVVPLARSRPKAARAANGVYVVEADSFNTALDQPFNLQNASLLFTPNGGEAFTVTRQALDYDSSVGTLFYTFPSSGTDADSQYRSYSLTKFTFPFPGASVTKIYLSTYRGIFLSPPVISVVTTNGIVYQYDAADMYGLGGVIAPLLHSTRGQRSRYVYVKEAADSLLITWRSALNGDDLTNAHGTDVQARLFANGNILFSYKRAPVWGDVIVTSGRETRRANASNSATLNDPLGDVTGTVSDAAIRDLLDLQSVTITRVAGTDVLECHVTVKGTPTATASLPDSDITYSLALTDSTTRATRSFPLAINKTQWTFLSVPNRPSALIEDHGFTVWVKDSAIPLTSPSVIVAVSSSFSGARDTVSGTVNLGTHSTDMEAGPAAFTGPTQLQAPVMQAYTLPSINVTRIWQQIKDAYNIGEGTIDGIAIYENFYSDTLLSGWSAYSTGGRANADGVFPTSRANLAKTTNVMQMNRINASEDYGRLLIHEFGHYWLYNVRIMEDGVKSQALNPLTAHPAQYVHIPAAFRVVADTDTSVMGGGLFKDNGNGSYTVASGTTYYGYSWHELYLMGLAAPSEVQPWFYIANSSPALGQEYFPPAGTYRGTRKDVVAQQLIDALGPRVPAYPDTPRDCKVMLALLERPSARATDDEISQVNAKRLKFEQNFPVATGNRARVSTTVDLTPRQAPVVGARATVDAAQFQPKISPGTIASLFGVSLAPAVHPAVVLPLPTSIDVVSVTVGNYVAPLFYVSPTQINFQVPWEIAGQTRVPITVTSGSFKSDSQMVDVAPVAPAIFSTDSTGNGQGAVVLPSGELAAPPGAIQGRASRPVKRGEAISIYCIGLGSVTSRPASGAPSGATPLSTTVVQPTVMIGDKSARVTFSGLAPGFVGLYQVNAEVPIDAPTGNAVPLMLSVSGVASNMVTIAVQ